jgi:hypothetical protein
MLGDVFDAVQKRPWETTQSLSPAVLKARRQAMRAVLERYIIGAHLNFNVDMKELGSLKPDSSMQGFWEFRSGLPVEQTRLFGFFARPGAFLATSFQPRGKFGGMSDPAWKVEREEGEKRWRALFGDKEYIKMPWPVASKDQFFQYLDRKDD